MSRLDQLKQLAALEPNDPMSHYGLGLEYINLQQWDDAAAAFGQALMLDAAYIPAYYHKARAEAGAGRATDARATLTAGMQAARSAGDAHAAGEMRELYESWS